MSQSVKARRRVPQRALDAYTFTEFPDHETIWAIAAGFDARIYVALCCETTGGGTVQLYTYDVEHRKMRHMLDVARALGEPPENGHAPHGKIHFSLCPSSDGFLYGATHCSTPPLGDRYWDAHTMLNDREKSFSGAHFFRYHPDRDEFEDFGVLFPGEGVGVMLLDEKIQRCAGITYPTGRLFFIQTDGTDLVDAGRVSESYTLSMISNGRGFAFATDTYGYFMRIDMKRRSVEHLQSRIPQSGNASGRYTAMCDSALGPDGYVYAVAYQMPNLFRFRPTSAGALVIEDLGTFNSAEEPVTGLVFADDGFLYARVGQRLGRFDIRKRRGEDLGELYLDGATHRFWRCVRGSDGRLYAGECGRKPVKMIIIDPRKL